MRSFVHVRGICYIDFKFRHGQIFLQRSENGQSRLSSVLSFSINGISSCSVPGVTSSLVGIGRVCAGTLYPIPGLSSDSEPCKVF